MTNRPLTDRQFKFLELLFKDGPPGRQIYVAADKIKVEAGYSETTLAQQIVDSVKDYIIQFNQDYLALNSGESISALEDVLRTPTQKGAETRLKAANSILDRAGFGKKETQSIEIKADKGIVILPSKINE
jgi:hypothetical protein